MLGGSALSLWIMGNCASEGSTITRVLRMPHVGRGSRLARGGALAATDLLLCPPNSTCVHVAALRATTNLSTGPDFNFGNLAKGAFSTNMGEILGGVFD